jgi:hypothetical protein
MFWLTQHFVISNEVFGKQWQTMANIGKHWQTLATLAKIGKQCIFKLLLDVDF